MPDALFTDRMLVLSGSFPLIAGSGQSPEIGESLPTVGRLLGHRRVTTTARYAHLARDTERASATTRRGLRGVWLAIADDHKG